MSALSLTAQSFSCKRINLNSLKFIDYLTHWAGRACWGAIPH